MVVIHASLNNGAKSMEKMLNLQIQILQLWVKNSYEGDLHYWKIYNIDINLCKMYLQFIINKYTQYIYY